MPFKEQGRRMGHEFIGIVEEVGADVSGFAPGDLVVAPFVWADNTCDFCREGLHTSCRHGGGWGAPGLDAGQGEAVRVPLAQGTLVKLPVAPDSALMPSLLTLSDVFCTGHHGAVTARVRAGHTVTVIGDGAVGLCGVLAAKRLGAEQIVLMGATPTVPIWAVTSVPPTSSPSAARRASIEFVSSPAATALTPSSNASEPKRHWQPL